MPKDLRIVFMGTPDFAVGILKEMIEAGRNIVGVITAPDKPAGRGRKLMTSAGKEYALSKNLKILQPTNLKDESFLKELKSLNANLQVVVAFRMLPKAVWQMPQLGTFNLHASLLPQYRGAAPINWAIINKEEKTGVTTFFIDEKIDTGSIISNKEVIIEKNETAETLHDKLMLKGSQLVLETLNLIEKGKADPKPQPESVDLKDAPKLTPENTQIDWTNSGKDIDAFIRGLSPYPVAWSVLYNNKEELKVKIYASSFEQTNHNLVSGNIQTSKKELKVACSDGFIYIKEIQLPGKRKMDVSSLLNGYSFDDDSKLS
ncbi:methionyl-tRNA formyltransferase [Aequorivita sublithincola DSM 14238]|uniref:Methionyl-tRNA formyltransferase n=1 Tax=Aequorivita sublithincola (strain DSM 14238 / LMG 21431 / ACAM 643 / 9-3) TaxID=746697 RepID=I3YY02_AEQSU|nr:methionyl-tRNA formyltransferase [Aequorivita sublithincola]AFL81870.1 methionyl-tRNA formyltransferase [Aequorivita sublithincola DSM 14238]